MGAGHREAWPPPWLGLRLSPPLTHMFRYAEVQGRLVEATTEGADEQIDRLSLRYTGNPTYQNRRPGMQRVLLKIEPTRVKSSLDRGQ